jgi:hypothetical protein
MVPMSEPVFTKAFDAYVCDGESIKGELDGFTLTATCYRDYLESNPMATITRGSDLPYSDRYKYDFRKCLPADGWAQLDTRQDASYYGNWVNPLTLELFSYCEGDIVHTKCADEADFIATLRTCVEWHREREYFIGIDGMLNEPIISALTRLGFAADLH